MSRLFLTPIDMGKLEIYNVRLQNLASAPGTPGLGQVYYDTVLNAAYVWNGTAWVATDVAKVANGGIPFAKLATPTAAFAMGGFKITGLGTPTTSGDAAEFTWVTTRPLNTFATPTAAVPMGGFKITGLGTPTTAGDAATYDWVNTQVQSSAAGISSKQPVRYVSTANLSLSGAATIDGTAVVTGDRVLAAAQTTTSQNGVYLANTVGVWNRSTNDSNAELDLGALWLVEQGTTFAGTQWRLSLPSTGAITVGSTGITIVQFSAANPYTAGNGLSLAAGVFAAVADPVSLGGITVSSSGIKVDSTVVARKFSQTLSTSATSYTITHNLGTQDVMVQVRLAASTFDLVDCDALATSTTQVTLNFAVAPTSNAYRVTVIG